MILANRYRLEHWLWGTYSTEWLQSIGMTRRGVRRGVGRLCWDMESNGDSSSLLAAPKTTALIITILAQFVSRTISSLPIIYGEELSLCLLSPRSPSVLRHLGDSDCAILTGLGSNIALRNAARGD